MKGIGLSAVVLLWVAACTGQQPSDPPPATDTSTADVAVPQGLIYDLRGIRQSTQAAELATGRIVRRTYELADGTSIVVDYDWTGGTIYCTAAKARAKGKLIAEVKSQNLTGSLSEGWRLVVDEVQYREDGTVAYRGTSTFSLGGLSDEKISEWPQEGRKLYEAFVNWGTLSPGVPGF